MVYCSKCGKQMEDGATFCSRCGAPLHNPNIYRAPLQNPNIYGAPKMNQPRKAGLGIAALVLGIVGVLAWIIPIIGLPVGIVALVFGILGLKKSSKGMSIAGIVLGAVCLVLTIINGAIGAYQGYHGEAWFQKGSNSVEENTEFFWVYENDKEHFSKISCDRNDHPKKKTVIKASICNGEQVAGLKDLHTGKIEEIMLIKSPADLKSFKEMYGIDEEIAKEY